MILYSLKNISVSCILSPEIKLTPDMVDAMGGDNSQYFELFKKTCTECFNELRRYSNIFIIMLSMLFYSKPNIDNGQYTLEYIQQQFRFDLGSYHRLNFKQYYT